MWDPDGIGAAARRSGVLRERLPMSRALHFLLGLICSALGFLGVFLPLLPTTPFLLLAAYGFARSSPTLHDRLRNSRSFGPYLRQWEHDHSIPAVAKRKAYVLILVTFGISIVLVGSWGLRAMLVLLAAGVITFLTKLRTTRDFVD